MHYNVHFCLILFMLLMPLEFIQILHWDTLVMFIEQALKTFNVHPEL